MFIIKIIGDIKIAKFVGQHNQAALFLALLTHAN